MTVLCVACRGYLRLAVFDGVVAGVKARSHDRKCSSMFEGTSAFQLLHLSDTAFTMINLENANKSSPAYREPP